MGERYTDLKTPDLNEAADNARAFFNSLIESEQMKSHSEENRDMVDPTTGRETKIIRGKRHWRGCIEKVWVRIGVNDPWGNGTAFPFSFLFDELDIRIAEGMRVTAYVNFPERDSEKAIAEYDLIVIRTHHGPRAHPYTTHENLLDANAAAQEKIDADQV